jgi:hypothetical protein
MAPWQMSRESFTLAKRLCAWSDVKAMSAGSTPTACESLPRAYAVDRVNTDCAVEGSASGV